MSGSLLSVGDIRTPGRIRAAGFNDVLWFDCHSLFADLFARVVCLTMLLRTDVRLASFDPDLSTSLPSNRTLLADAIPSGDLAHGVVSRWHSVGSSWRDAGAVIDETGRSADGFFVGVGAQKEVRPF